MSTLTAVLKALNQLLWGFPMLLLLSGTHLFLTWKTDLIQRRLPLAIRLSLTPETEPDTGGNGLTPFAALSTALASPLGTGNIIGVGTAIALGGPGAVFWCWITGFFGIATTYAEALRSAMREAPDVILLGEMRDQETIGTAMTAAEMAQLLFSTLHTTGASSTVDRIIDAFPANQQRQIRMQLSLVLQAVVSQQLVPTVDGGIVPVFEIMTATPAIRNLIREEKTHQIDSVIASSSGAGMRTMDQSLHRLVKEGTISKEVALQHAIHQEALKKRFETEGM